MEVLDQPDTFGCLSVWVRGLPAVYVIDQLAISYGICMLCVAWPSAWFTDRYSAWTKTSSGTTAVVFDMAALLLWKKDHRQINLISVCLLHVYSHELHVLRNRHVGTALLAFIGEVWLMQKIYRGSLTYACYVTMLLYITLYIDVTLSDWSTMIWCYSVRSWINPTQWC